MALIDEVEARYSDQLLTNLTNPQDSPATSIGTAKLQDACDDVEADFQVYCGVEYDNADARHVSTAVQGVIIKLRQRTGQIATADFEDTWISRLEALAKVTGRDRVLPVTDGALGNSDETNGGQITIKEFDPVHFDQVIPDTPQTGRSFTDNTTQ